MAAHLTDSWFKCYGNSWTGIITPESFCHPAKFSRALIRRIYAHAIEEGWIEKNSVVIDLFGGVALGGLEAMRRGLHWVGVELEARFCALAQDNIDLWNKRYSAQMPNWGTAVIVQGDSRRLGEVLERAQLCLSSPPYAHDAEPHGDLRPDDLRPSGKIFIKRSYGREQGQLAQMPPGNHAAALEAQAGAGAETGRAELCLSSPPWIGTNREFNSNTGARQAIGDWADRKVQYAESRVSLRNKYKYMSPEWLEHRKQTAKSQNLSRLPATAKDPDYPTFWAASRQILEQVYKVLAPGAHAIFVCKRFIRNKQIVEFSTQWAHLCEAVGFKWIHHHKAWLVEDRGAQHTLEGGLEKRQVKRMSFLRRLHARKYPHLEILYEDVLCFVKPL